MIVLPDGAKFDMKWKSVSYIKDGIQLIFEIVPMLERADIVLIPSEYAWEDYTDIYSLDEREDIIYLLDKINWRREIDLLEVDIYPTFCREGEFIPPPGTLEWTLAGMELERLNLFDPDERLREQKGKDLYLLLESKFAQMALGDVRIPRCCVIEGSVLERLTLPILESNPEVNLIFDD